MILIYIPASKGKSLSTFILGYLPNVNTESKIYPYPNNSFMPSLLLFSFAFLWLITWKTILLKNIFLSSLLVSTAIILIPSHIFNLLPPPPSRHLPTNPHLLSRLACVSVLQIWICLMISLRTFVPWKSFFLCIIFFLSVLLVYLSFVSLTRFTFMH